MSCKRVSKLFIASLLMFFSVSCLKNEGSNCEHGFLRFDEWNQSTVNFFSSQFDISECNFPPMKKSNCEGKPFCQEVKTDNIAILWSFINTRNVAFSTFLQKTNYDLKGSLILIETYKFGERQYFFKVKDATYQVIINEENVQSFEKIEILPEIVEGFIDDREAAGMIFKNIVIRSEIDISELKITNTHNSVYIN